MKKARSPAVLTTLRRLLRDRWKQLSKHVDQIEKGDGAKQVHDLRVTTRRLQELTLLAAEVGKGPRAANTLKALRQARRLCTHVRDADVMRGMIRERMNRSAREMTTWEPVQRQLTRLRTKEHSRLRQSLRRADLRNLSEQWLTALNDWPKSDPKVERRMLQRLNEHLAKRLRQFQRSRDTAMKPNAAIEDIHNMRLSGKRLRYALEAARDFSDGHAREALGQLRTFQEALGDWSDLDMLGELIVQQCSRKKFLRAQPGAAQRLLQAMGRVRTSQGTKLHRAKDLAGDMKAVSTVLEEVTALKKNGARS